MERVLTPGSVLRVALLPTDACSHKPFIQIFNSLITYMGHHFVWSGSGIRARTDNSVDMGGEGKSQKIFVRSQLKSKARFVCALYNLKQEHEHAIMQATTWPHNLIHE